MLHVPRAVRFAAWATAVLRGRADLGRLTDAVTDPDDDTHRVEGVPGDAMAGLLEQLRECGATAARAVLPVPGDVTGLPGPAAFNVAACSAGAAVLSIGGRQAMGIVPHEVGYGSTTEPGVLVTWSVWQVHHRPHAEVADLGEADRALRSALIEATEVLSELDVARSRPEVAELWADLAGAGIDPGALPPDVPSRAVLVLTSALRLRAIVALALADDGGSVSGWEAQQRRGTLRQLDGVARHAVHAAATPQPPPAERAQAQRTDW